MQSLTAVFDGQKYTREDIARVEDEIWAGLKLSGELNRVKRDGNWVLHYTCEENIKEDNLKKIKVLDSAVEVRLRDLIEDAKGRKKSRSGNQAEDNLESDDTEAEDED